MKIEIIMAQPGVDGELTAYNQAGEQVEVSRIVWEPHFYRASSTGNVAFLRVSDSTNQVVHQAALLASGRNGSVMLQDRTVPIKPKFEAEKAPGGA